MPILFDISFQSANYPAKSIRIKIYTADMTKLTNYFEIVDIVVRTHPLNMITRRWLPIFSLSIF
ncbi:hypothetical protein C492_19092 [Natronococcus jeotgali DSM 18795]|uniref:Uncharacterized protein n=1 Tax=Natronococcus jeotgali DSM 18795 TaxID=1227498 RepID=L9WU81_9EURY|nr:hypothetical protein C492_19092 [Natronococcus jeotgali DSM 18795]